MSDGTYKCPSCVKGYENHEYYCNHGRDCVKREVPKYYMKSVNQIQDRISSLLDATLDAGKYDINDYFADVAPSSRPPEDDSTYPAGLTYDLSETLGDGVAATTFGDLDKIDPQPSQSSAREQDEIYTGGSSDYYKVRIENPTSSSDPYTAECNDIIEALGMNFAEGNVFKAVWRTAAARLAREQGGIVKRGYDDGTYDAEKVVFFGQRMVEMARRRKK